MLKTSGTPRPCLMMIFRQEGGEAYGKINIAIFIFIIALYFKNEKLALVIAVLVLVL